MSSRSVPGIQGTTRSRIGPLARRHVPGSLVTHPPRRVQGRRGCNVSPRDSSWNFANSGEQRQRGQNQHHGLDVDRVMHIAGGGLDLPIAHGPAMPLVIPTLLIRATQAARCCGSNCAVGNAQKIGSVVYRIAVATTGNPRTIAILLGCGVSSPRAIAPATAQTAAHRACCFLRSARRKIRITDK
jgi:hypothetical protein